MRNAFIPALVVAALIIVIAVIFRSVLHKSLDVVPLFLVPVFFYVGYLTAKSAKAWLLTTVAVTAALAVLYALS